VIAANARAGRPHGMVPYGYRREYDPRDGRPIAQVADPLTSRLIRRLFAELREGRSLSAITREFADRGWVNRSGRPFTRAHLRSLAANPAYAGLRVYRPRTSQPFHAPGQWQALVPEEVFWEVQSLLADPMRSTTRPGGTRHLLSMIACCDVCGGPLAVRYVKNRAYGGSYVCHRSGHVLAEQAAIDRYVQEVVQEHLSAPGVVPGLLTGAGQEWAALPLATKRKVLRFLLVPERLGQARLTRSTARLGLPGTPIPERLVFRREAYEEA
jgi:site-specific DNA recombinase